MDIIISLATIVAVGLIAIAWGGSGKGRGAFSALLNFICVVLAGAFAFSAWEFVVYEGIFSITSGGGFLDDLAWSIGLIVPFAIVLLVLKLATDALIPSNIDLDDPINIGGGLLFGALSGGVTVGICLIGISASGIGPTMLGHTHTENDRGNILYSKSLLVPFDDLTVQLYETLSLHTFGTENALARTLPQVNHQLALARNVYQGDKSEIGRPGIRPSDVEILGQYSITGQSPNEIIDDSLGGFPSAPKRADGTTLTSGSKLFGYVVKFDAGAKESSGQVIVGPGLVRLVATPPEGAGIGIQPIAIVARAQAESQLYRRYKMDSEDRFIPSAGASAESYFGFEFPVPANYTPSHLIIKNTRIPLDDVNAPTEFEFQGFAGRDSALNNGTLLTSFGVPGGESDFSRYDFTNSIYIGSADSIDSRRSQLPGRFALIKGQTGGLAVGGSDNTIISGQHAFSREAITGVSAGPLRVDTFQVPGSANMVVLELVDLDGQLTTLGQSLVGATGELALVSSAVESFPAIGFVYADQTTVSIRYTPADVIENIESELPGGIGAGRACFLIFHVTKGSDITLIAADNTVLVDFEPPVQLDQRRRR